MMCGDVSFDAASSEEASRIQNQPVDRLVVFEIAISGSQRRLDVDCCWSLVDVSVAAMDDLITFCVEQIAFDGDQGESQAVVLCHLLPNSGDGLTMSQAPNWNTCGDLSRSSCPRTKTLLQRSTRRSSEDYGDIFLAIKSSF